LGEILVEERIISPAQLSEALALKKEKGGFLGAILVELRYLSQDTLISFLVKQCKIPHLSLLDYHISEEVLALLPQEICLKYGLLPIDKLGRILTVAMTDPLDIDALEKVREVCPELRIKPILCSPQHFETVTNQCFNLQKPASETMTAASLGFAGQAPKQAPNTQAEEAAMDAAVNDLVREAAIHTEATAPPAAVPAASPAPLAHAAVPEGEDLAEMLRQTMSDAVQEAMAVAAVQAKASMPGNVDLARAVRESVSEGLSKSLAPLLERLLGSGEAKAVAEMRRQDLTGAKRRHASVMPFGRTGMAEIAQELLERDELVELALESPRPLTGFTFDAFLPGTANAFTYSLAQGVAAEPGGDFNPFFIYGGVGLGKTHLINAIGNAILARSEGARVGYVSASRFASALMDATQDQAVEEFRKHYCCWDVLILDDIQFLGGRVPAQEEFFHIFNALQHEKRQIIIAADKAPDRLGLLEQRLVSRFAGGIVAQVKPPEYETRVEILRRHVDGIREQVSDDVLGMIAMRVPDDVRKMTGALRKVAAYARHAGKAPNCDVAAEVLGHLGVEEAA
jgi:chromosomal replication initiator protein DnaA